jgi:hypothetical protein
MDDEIAGEHERKADFLAGAINRLLQNLCLKCLKGEDEVRDYFSVCVIGYGASVGPALSGALAGKPVIPISDIAFKPARIETRFRKTSDGAGGIIEQEFKLPIWIDPIADGTTPMKEALELAREIVGRWTRDHPSCFPPVVMHFTDGEANSDPTGMAERLRSLQTTDGKVLLLNAHVSSQGGREHVFPHTGENLPDEFATMLFQMSSTLPRQMADYARNLGYPIKADARGYVYNARAEHVVSMLKIGTEPVVKALLPGPASQQQ